MALREEPRDRARGPALFFVEFVRPVGSPRVEAGAMNPQRTVFFLALLAASGMGCDAPEPSPEPSSRAAALGVAGYVDVRTDADAVSAVLVDAQGDPAGAVSFDDASAYIEWGEHSIELTEVDGVTSVLEDDRLLTDGAVENVVALELLGETAQDLPGGRSLVASPQDQTLASCDPLGRLAMTCSILQLLGYPLPQYCQDCL
ncbi:MAG: hypothetical protein KDK70_38975 [Myxococcales bacterium]|nr:hypothetical protein [Myxococcales bacterium]